ncbi:acyl carrier protein [Paenibacillus radicis (ex Gao et al. 2016)]|nr:acyl carrier protein [Paenibacillus radicis (ex Gao et al. 2016)]
MNILQEIRPECDFASSNDFMNDGLLDSFDMVSLVTELEEKYSILIDPLDMVPEYFSSVSAIASLVRKSGADVQN